MTGTSSTAGVVETAGVRAPMDAAGRRVLVIAPAAPLTFVAQDIDILSQRYPVDVMSRGEFGGVLRFVAALVRRLRSGSYGLVYVWFAEPYDSPYIVLACRLLRVPCAIVVGGYDVTNIPALGYGALGSRKGRRRVRAALRFADAIFPTSDLLASEVRALGRTHGVRVIYPGVDCRRFSPGDRREPLVVTVGSIAAATWRLKGLDVFAATSRLVPNVGFLIVGPCTDAAALAELRKSGGENLAFTERALERDELAALLRRASVYAQLSVRESFGLALAEAMAAGCVPVTSAAGFMPQVVGDTGFLVEYGDVVSAAAAINQALASDRGSRARTRIERSFPLERREQHLVQAVAACLGEAAC